MEAGSTKAVHVCVCVYVCIYLCLVLNGDINVMHVTVLILNISKYKHTHT